MEKVRIDTQLSAASKFLHRKEASEMPKYPALLKYRRVLLQLPK